MASRGTTCLALTNIRYALLQKLMSDEIRLKDAEKSVEEKI